MFNVVGYFNYRYFVNFLLYTAMGMMYGTIVTFRLFMMIDSREYHQQIGRSREIYEHENHRKVDNMAVFRYRNVQHLMPNVPIPNESSAIAFEFMMCFAVGLSVLILLGFHLYLILTAQTTIEFHGNRLKKEECQMRNEVFCNPYDMGWKRNLEQVWGSWKGGWLRFFTVLLPSRRENQFLPIPFRGDSGMCSRWDGTFVDDLDDEYADNMV
jgi:palmitoyltransferase